LLRYYIIIVAYGIAAISPNRDLAQNENI
jgi:hypothetical protein